MDSITHNCVTEVYHLGTNSGIMHQIHWQVAIALAALHVMLLPVILGPTSIPRVDYVTGTDATARRKHVSTSKFLCARNDTIMASSVRCSMS